MFNLPFEKMAKIWYNVCAARDRRETAVSALFFRRFIRGSELTCGGFMEAKLYKTGDMVMYGTNGICAVTDIQKMMFPMETEERTYYVLKPVNTRNSTLFVPEDNEQLMSKMRQLLGREEIDEAINQSDKSVKWIDDRNARFAYFNSVLKTADPKELLSVIRCIYLRKQEVLALGKKMASADETVLASAEKLVREEFAYTLGIPEADVGEYIRANIK